LTVKLRLLLAAIAACALVPLWGYWYSIRHADLQLYVNDSALKSPTQSYGNPHGVSLVFRDASNRELAVARSVEPMAYILAVHPDGAIGNCQHLTQQGGFGSCYARYSRWSATWADRVRTADVTVGSCSLRAVPVVVQRSNEDWPLWWVPLRHISGLPRQYFGFGVSIDSRACAAVTPAAAR
jgi:hypothetical protein